MMYGLEHIDFNIHIRKAINRGKSCNKSVGNRMFNLVSILYML